VSICRIWWAADVLICLFPIICFIRQRRREIAQDSLLRFTLTKGGAGSILYVVIKNILRERTMKSVIKPFFDLRAVVAAISLLLIADGTKAQDSLFAPAVNYGVDYPTSIFSADVDNDSDFDLAVTNIYSDNVCILLNNGDGTFAAAGSYEVGDDPTCVFSADVDNDSDFDLAVTNPWSNNVSILLNNGDGTFAAAVNYGVGDSPWSVFSADLDNDSDFDLAVANSGDFPDFYGSVSILLNNGNGTFATAVNYGVGTLPKSVFSADFDGDSDFDLVVANYYSDNVCILLNNGDGTFVAAVNYGAGDRPGSVFSSDYDGDGDFDLAVANYGTYPNSGNVSILLNNGDGTFAAPLNFGVGVHPTSVFSADFDNDSDFDLAVANSYSNSVSILLNNGNGTFAAEVSYAVGYDPISVFSADFDNDSDFDLAVANYGAYPISGSVSVLLNRTNSPIIVSGVTPSTIGPSTFLCLEVSGYFPDTVSTIRLKNSDGVEINGTSIMKYGGTSRISALFNLSGQNPSTWDLIVTGFVAVDTLVNAVTLVSEGSLAPIYILEELTAWHHRLRDLSADASAITSENGVPFDSLLVSELYYRIPDTSKTVFFANTDTTQILNTVIVKGINQYEIAPDTDIVFYTNLLTQSGLTLYQYNGLNYFSPSEYLSQHYVNVLSYYGTGDSLTFVLEAVPKAPIGESERTELHINYGKGVVTKTIDDLEDTVQAVDEVFDVQDTAGVFLPFGLISTIYTPTDTFTTTTTISDVAVNAGIPDSVFWFDKAAIVTGPDSLLADTLAETPPARTVECAPDWSKWQEEGRYRPDPVLFLHGICSQPSVWNIAVGELDDHYNYDPDKIYLKRVDFDPKCGSVDGPGGWADQVRDSVNSMLDVFKPYPNQVILVGHSQGGLAAREYATNSDRYGDSYLKVSQIVTMVSPHLGSPLADWAEEYYSAHGVKRFLRTVRTVGMEDRFFFLMMVLDRCQKVGQPCLEDLRSNCSQNPFLQTLSSRNQHEDAIRYSAIWTGPTYNVMPDRIALPGPDDGIVPAFSQITVHDSPNECQSYGNWTGGKMVVPGLHMGYPTQMSVIAALKKLIDTLPRLRIVAPDPNEQCGSQPCSLKIELLGEYLPATTQLHVTITEASTNNTVFDLDTCFGPHPGWNQTDNDHLRGYYADSIPALCNATAGKYVIRAESINPGGHRYIHPDVEITLGVDLAVELWGGGLARAGFPKTYGVRYENIGCAAAEDVTVQISIPPEVSYVSSSPPGQVNGNVVSWQIGTVAAKGSGNLNVTVAIPVIGQGTPLSAQSDVSTSSEDFDQANNNSLDVETVVNSWDPNDKLVTPLGVGQQRWIAEGQRLRYTITFENADTATAEAVNIVVVDTLDPDLDWATLAIGPMSHSEKCEAVFDSATGVITWTCDSIMLPPNVTPPEGEGWFTYSISPYYLPHGSQLENAVFIKFDFNPWIMAPQDSVPVMHTIDEFPPESHIYALFDTSDAEVELLWTGRDDSLGLGSGVASYSIYVSLNGGPYEPWLVNTEDTTATFTGEYGQTYYFYSVAKDSVGNLEEAPSVPDAYTIITTYICGDINGDGNGPNVVDLTYLVDYLFRSGPPPPVMDAANVNGQGGVNVVDVTYLVDYLFRSGPPPDCQPMP
jgi:uncharacterized repeat protein (TIGR01451 family)